MKVQRHYHSLIEDNQIQKNDTDLLSSLRNVEDRSVTNYLSLFPSQDIINRSLPNAFVYMVPMEGVGGDGYWLYEHKQSIYFVLFDCMGHGYRASMMVRMYIRALNKIIKEKEITDPAKILDNLHDRIEQKFSSKEGRLGTGADFAVLKINPLQYEMYYSGARINLYEINEEGLHVIKSARKQVGEMFEYEHRYETTRIDMKDRKKSKFYLFSDGIADLIGGQDNKKFGTKRLKDLLIEAYKYPIKRQKAFIAGELNNWQGSNAAVDDCLLFGFTL